ncbi:Rz1-like lysis system protein LysC [Oceanobacter kriegii]|uniref:Rz1-like lysis system protein LysC n=1 Tax=Oceanobacter kriegii TaxID=64972 RepID=UPI003899627D
MKFKTGLASLSLLALSGCSNAPEQPPAQVIVTNPCPILSPCVLSPVSIETNEDLVNALNITENDWLQCAIKVDSIISCQQTDTTDGQAQ